MSGDIRRGSLNSTDENQLIEELQYTLGEGPCVDACQQDWVVAEPDLADPVARRWPANGEQHADALVVADVAARWVLDAQAGAPPAAVAKELEAGADFHFAAYNAAGMVSVQERISVAEALIRPRVLAFSSDRLLADVADDVVARRLRLG